MTDQASGCKQCNRGTYTNNIPGNTECIDCPQGTRGRDETDEMYVGLDASCFECEPGKASETFGSLACEPCRAKSYASSSGMKACDLCVAGSVCPKDGMKAPASCPTGSSCGIRGLRFPVLCPTDTYQDEEEQTSCKECAGLRNKTNARTYGIIGAFMEVACVDCPDGGDCGPGTVRQALRSAAKQ